MTSIATKIDQLVFYHHRKITKFTELNQLAMFFDWNFLSDLKNVLFHNKQISSQKKIKKTQFILSWIDKSPYAKFVNAVYDANNNIIKQKVELGDAAIVFLDIPNLTKGMQKSTKSKALLLQAKIGSSNSTQRVPIYSSKNVSSTSKELALYRNWDDFDLYHYSNSKIPQQQNISFPRWNTKHPPYGWYCVCPRSPNHQWKSPWMCAPASNGKFFNTTFGKMLVSFFQNNRIYNSSIGDFFQHEPNWPAQNISGFFGWDIVINEILAICKISALPQYIFGNNAGKKSREIISMISIDDVFYSCDDFGPYFFKTNCRVFEAITATNKKKFPVLTIIQYDE
ncbi:MAG: hypothetical protein KDD46_08620 [Bdellovibrionales bacterium]|nr:hypothetical protein [Bdellovibrionales bacterium]MCB1052716.1 hypothetical protein [Acidobacteriota bacterium]MCB9397374.1 hypothetical protein [Acidobacteriota bacterium]